MIAAKYKIYLCRASPRNFHFKSSKPSEITVRLNELLALRQESSLSLLLKRTILSYLKLCLYYVATWIPTLHVISTIPNY